MQRDRFSGSTGKEKQMTTKELLYVDDALSHSQLLATQFENAASQLQDASLRVQKNASFGCLSGWSKRKRMTQPRSVGVSSAFMRQRAT